MLAKGVKNNTEEIIKLTFLYFYSIINYKMKKEVRRIKMKIWVDDIRECTDDYDYWFKSTNETIKFLRDRQKYGLIWIMMLEITLNMAAIILKFLNGWKMFVLNVLLEFIPKM